MYDLKALLDEMLTAQAMYLSAPHGREADEWCAKYRKAHKAYAKACMNHVTELLTDEPSTKGEL